MALINLALRYPNGRTHEAIVERDAPLEVGDEFELYGRRWRALQPLGGRSRPQTSADRRPMLCFSVTETAAVMERSWAGALGNVRRIHNDTPRRV
jgi:hypothetical protein